MFPNPNPHNRRSQMLSGETVVGRLTSPNGTYVANPYPTTSAIGGTGAYGAMYSMGAQERNAPMPTTFAPNPGMFQFQRNENIPLPIDYIGQSFGHMGKSLGFLASGEGNIKLTGRPDRPDKNPFAVPPTTTMGAGTLNRPAGSKQSGAGGYSNASLMNTKSIFLSGSMPARVMAADVRALGFDNAMMLKNGYSYDPATSTYSLSGSSGGGTGSGGGDDGWAWNLPGERGDKVAGRWGEEKIGVTQSEDGIVKAGYVSTYSSGRAANYGKRGNKWKTIVSGGVKMTVPDRGRGSGKRRNKESRGEVAQQVGQKPVEEQISTFGLVDMGLRLATG